MLGLAFDRRGGSLTDHRRGLPQTSGHVTDLSSRRCRDASDQERQQDKEGNDQEVW